MLSPLLLDKLIPLPSEEELTAALCRELTEQGFPIDNLKNGGVFYTLLRVFVRIKVELLGLCREMLRNVYVSSADRVDWLELRAADFGKTRKPALKTKGVLTLSRTAAPVRIRRGCIFKTDPGASGEELQFVSLEDVSVSEGADDLKIKVAAESAGSAYNIPAGRITRSLIHLEGVTQITNAEDWITREGSDDESIEGLRARTLGVFSELATNPTRDKYKNVCEAVPGVLCVAVDDLHPRGQGTIDILITSATGEASEALLEEVRAAAAKIAGPYDNILVKASDTVEQPIAATLTLPAALSEEGIAARAEEVLRRLFQISLERSLNVLYLSDLIVAMKTELPTVKNVRVTTPKTDLILGKDKVIVPGTVAITIERA